MNNQFSENLKKVRKDHNLSQEQLADELGVSRQAISKWESSTAYPEMDKIIALCDKFDLNIDDLLHRDIKEIKGEEESRNKLNKFIDDFLNFITNTINLFSRMSFKSKIKCLIEQTIIILILMGISLFTLKVGSVVLSNIFQYIPFGIRYFIETILISILGLFCLIFSIIIIVHVFKTRYLDYYEKFTSNINNEDVGAKIIENKKLDKKEPISNKINFRKDENKIIIRDPKYSSYKFINSLFKFIIGIIKFFALCFTIFICFILVMLFLGLILSFLVYKTGLFFLGLLITILSLAIITIIILLILLNFVFDRKNDKKKMIWSFILSLPIFGIGIGLIFIGMLNFDITTNDKSLLKQKTVEYTMNDELFFNFMINNVKYVEDNIDNIKVVYEFNKYYEIDENRGIYGIHPYIYCSSPIKLVKEIINDLNEKKMIAINDEIYEVTVYASKENIDKLKINRDNYFKRQNNYIISEQERDSYEQTIYDLKLEIENYADKMEEYKDTIEELNSQILEYQKQIDTYENA